MYVCVCVYLRIVLVVHTHVTHHNSITLKHPQTPSNTLKHPQTPPNTPWHCWVASTQPVVHHTQHTMVVGAVSSTNTGSCCNTMYLLMHVLLVVEVVVVYLLMYLLMYVMVVVVVVVMGGVFVLLVVGGCGDQGLWCVYICGWIVEKSTHSCIIHPLQTPHSPAHTSPHTLKPPPPPQTHTCITQCLCIGMQCTAIRPIPECSTAFCVIGFCCIHADTTPLCTCGGAYIVEHMTDTQVCACPAVEHGTPTITCV